MYCSVSDHWPPTAPGGLNQGSAETPEQGCMNMHTQWSIELLLPKEPAEKPSAFAELVLLPPLPELIKVDLPGAVAVHLGQGGVQFGLRERFRRLQPGLLLLLLQ